MKKRGVLLAAILGMAVISGCTGDNSGNRGNYEEPEAAATPTVAGSDIVVEDDPTPTAPPQDLPTAPEYAMVGYHMNEKEMAERLDGVWYLNEGANMIQDPNLIPDTLIIDSDTMTATYHMAYAAEEAYYDISFNHEFDIAENALNGLELTCTGVTDGFPIQKIDALYSNFYVTVCENNLILREYGNGLSQLAEDVIGYERQGYDGWWVFIRDDMQRDPVYPYERIDWDKERRTDSVFYAIRYADWGNSCDLQEVEAEIFENIMLYGMEKSALALRYADNGHPFSVINYNYKGMEMYAHSGAYSPSLVEVMTDENGDILYWQDIPYYGLGYFELPTASGAPDVSRDDKRYDAADKAFLGDWTADDSSTIKIEEADPQTGGYHAEISIYRLAVIDAYLNMDGDDLSINQGFIGNDRIEGKIEATSKGIRFTVTGSEFDLLEVGTVIDFEK